MTEQDVRISKEFKAQAIKAILAVCFFAVAFMIILFFAVALTVLCFYIDGYILALAPSFFTLLLAIGLASLGVLVLVFLLKFITSKTKTDDNQLIEITKEEEPKLFTMIGELAQAIGTKFPKRVFLCADVNAAVSYQSNFWSMFVPTRKNLVIGLGLVNTMTQQELKAILAHEFGHFSQRTMKVGSYVYNVNRVIFNILYYNEGYKSGIARWGKMNWLFEIFVLIAIKINEAIQWILRNLYTVVNKRYLGLSREMEFHADAIAASVTGRTALRKALLRTTLADASYNTVLDYYSKKIPDNIKSHNIYIEQFLVLQFLAEVNNHPLSNNLPDISLEEQSRFDKSKLVIKDQWASHPSIKDRILRLDQPGSEGPVVTDGPAKELFTDIKSMQQRLTENLFKLVSYEGEIQTGSPDVFFDTYKKEFLAASFGKLYNGYYDYKNPSIFDLDQFGTTIGIQDFRQCYSDEKVDWVYTAISLKNDIEILQRITNKELNIKTFDYDGVRYSKKEAVKLNHHLKEELDLLNNKINNNDSRIFCYFKNLEKRTYQPVRLEQLYQQFFEFDKAFEDRCGLYDKLMEQLQFVQAVTPFEKIIENFENIKPNEQKLKSIIKDLLSNPMSAADIPTDIYMQLEKYSGDTWIYFEQKAYLDDNLDLLIKGLQNYAYLLSRSYFLIKKQLLDYQLQLQEAILIIHSDENGPMPQTEMPSTV